MSSQQNAGQQYSPGLKDLDDAVLVNVFGRLDPLPHLFNVALVCKRFRKLAGDGRLSLRVAGVGLHHKNAAGHRQLSFQTLQEAVLSSRPGDTIVVAPGIVHYVQDIAVEWPLRLLGGGSVADETSLICLSGARTAMNFRASGILANLCVRSEQAACITHHRGRLVVDSCLLHSAPAPGLEHLFTPLVTFATGTPEGQHIQYSHSSEPLQRSCAGVLSVRETKIRGGEGMRAIQASGTGAIAGVRVINFSADSIFWFEVDSSRPLAGQAILGTAAQTPTWLSARGWPQTPRWAVDGVPLFPQIRRIGKFHGDSAAGDKCKISSPGEQERAVELELRSQAWQQSGGRSIRQRIAE